MATSAPVYHRWSRRCQTMFALFLVAAGAGCARSGSERPALALASTPAVVAGDALPAPEHVRFSTAVPESDWTVLRRALATALVETEDGATVVWENAETGSRGTVTPLVVARSRGGSLCRSFAATVDAGIGDGIYRGEACRKDDGRWELLGVVAQEAAR